MIVGRRWWAPMRPSDRKSGICAAAVQSPPLSTGGKIGRVPANILAASGQFVAAGIAKGWRRARLLNGFGRVGGIAQAAEVPGRRTGIGQLKGFRGLVSGRFTSNHEA